MFKVDFSPTIKVAIPGVSTVDTRHGGPYDRGGADSYYRRGRHPHYYKGSTILTERVEEKDMTAEEVAAYNRGYFANERAGDFKDWGVDLPRQEEDDEEVEE